MTVTPVLAQARGLEAIQQANGVGIAIMGMLIVFIALAIIAFFIRILPTVLDKLDPYLPQVSLHHAPPTAAERSPADDQRIVAAIGFVLHEEMKRAVAGNK